MTKITDTADYPRIYQYLGELPYRASFVVKAPPAPVRRYYGVMHAGAAPEFFSCDEAPAITVKNLRRGHESGRESRLLRNEAELIEAGFVRFPEAEKIV